MRDRARPGRPALRRAISWVVVVAAVSFVAWVIPIRDRCRDPASKAAPRVGVTWVSGGCVLHERGREVRLDAPACARLDCEPGIASTFARTDKTIVLAMLAVYFLGTVTAAGRWRTLLALARVDIALGDVWRIFAQAQAGGILLPGGIGGDALRIAAVVGRPTRDGAERAPASIAIASVLLDRAVGLALIAAVAASMGWAFGGLHAGALVVILTLLPVGLVVGLAILRLAPAAWLERVLRGRVGAIVAPVLAYVRDPGAPRAVSLAAVWSLAVAAIQFVVIRGLVAALGAHPTDEKWIYLGTTMAFLVSAIPTLPGAWGTADAAYVYFFKFAGVSPAVALAVCLLFRLFWYVLGVTGAVLQIVWPVPFDPGVARAGAPPRYEDAP
jgi:uncharacterized membrane protein YbhN (UPF0104 family)